MIGFYFSISSLTIMSVFTYVFFSKKRVNNAETKIYGYLLITSLVMSALEIITAIIFMLHNNTTDILYLILAKIVPITYVVANSLFCKYLITVCTDENNIANKVLKISLIACIAIMIITPMHFMERDGSITPVGIPIFTALGFCIASMLYQISLCIKYNKTISIKKFTPFYSFIIIGVVNIIVMLIFPSAFLIGYMFTITIIIMYFTIENPDVKMVEEMAYLKEEADKANHAKSDFLSNMSHEIRTPLNAIVGFSESLKDDELSKDQLEKVDDIIMASNNLLDIVNGILDISKIEANKLEIIDKEYDIKSVLDELCALTKARMGDSGLEFRVNIDPTLPRVLYGDNVRLKQIVLNLLTNAVKYTKEGYVDFTVSSVIRDNVCRLIISVEDSGIGIKEEAIPRLFSKFDRLNVEKSITIEGTGLGLAITKKLVELMNGTIIVQSVYGQGSKFTVSIDQRVISVKPKETPRPAVESKTIKAYGAKVLLVDDNELNIKVATTLLKKYDFNIDSCISGRECLEKIRLGNKYDIIFLDDMMPRMSGKEVLVALKKMENFNTPVIALTANAISGMREEYLSLGFDDYLSKPIEKKELERVITTYIHKSNVQEMNSSSSNNASSIIDFDFQLPMLAGVHKEEVAEPKEEAPETPKEENTLCKRLLIVDDNDVNLKVATSAFKNYSSEIVTVKSGSEAIEKVITEERFDLILLDDMMPEMDGPTTLDNLRDIDGFDVPTVLTTASSEDEVQDKLEEHHFDGYLSKPFKKEEIEALLNALLNK